MLNKLLLVLIFIYNVNASEVSVFGAGDINSAKPYGLSKSEIAVYNNKKKLDKLNNKFNNLKSSYEELNQKIQGISSVYENDSESLNKAKRTISSINNDIKSTSSTIEKIKQLSLSNSDGLINLEKRLDDFITLQEKNNIKVESSLQSITKLLNKINNNYVTNRQFDELVSFVNSGKSIKKQSSIKKTTPKSNKLSNKQKLKEAIKMVNKMYLTKSIPLWNDLLKAKYKPATVNFYLGEVRFGRKEYKKAISHYKTSMMLYDEASYIPTLLLHSAISFEKTNDNENAVNFYSTLVDTYPSSKEAIKAKKQLNKLQ